jgi:nitrogen fixation protein FixH
MAAILIAGFGVVVAVNLIMARFAVSTFGGVVVENSYVASQQFNGWLEQADRSRAIGWKPRVARLDDDRIVVDFGSTSTPRELAASARQPLGNQPDMAMTFASAGSGRFTSEAPLPLGRWTLRLEGRAGDKAWRGEVELP